VVVVVFWKVMSTLSRRANRPYEVTASTLASFTPSVDGWRLTRLPVEADRLEPHVAVFRQEKSGRRPVVMRLLHGYNMCDCMRIKHHKVELVVDTRGVGEGLASNSQHPTTNIQQPISNALRSVVGGRGVSSPGAIRDPQSAICNQPSLPIQVWRLTSPTGDRSIWVTSMLAAYDFGGTDVDTRSMAFPKVDTPDAPGYNPQGITLKSLRHPIRSLRASLNAHWNKSRCDWLTAVGLRKPAWASHSMFTLVSASKGATVRPEEEDGAIEHVIEAHTAFHAELIRWRAAQLESP